MTWKTNVFGVRHLSPSGAWHLRQYLDRVKPKVVLVEGLSDAEETIAHIVKKTTRPPIAILAYTDSVPVRTLVYPFARYSPEFQALLWAKENNARSEWIDLPSDIFLGLQDQEIERTQREIAKKKSELEDKESESEDESETGETQEPAKAPETEEKSELPQVSWIPERGVSLYERIAERADESNYDTYWERRFEHNLSDDSYRLAAFELGKELRNEEDPPVWRAENLVREAYMRRRIEEVIADGVKPEQIVVVVGAFHAPVMSGEFPAMTDAELAQLPKRASKLTLMPYSYFKLSTQSGYGAGNHAPSYFELMWDALESGHIKELPARYLARVARHMRDSGTHRSSAEVIEGVRLASTLSALHDGLAPTLQDLRDAAVALIGHGEMSSVSEALSRVDVGTAIGELPRGVSRTSIQADFEREMTLLKLEKYRTTVKQELSLDLREDRRAKTQETAYLDLRRSSFFHRLRVLEIPFATPLKSSQQSTTWGEKWHLQWSPESEIALVEAVLLGETIELATGFKFKTNLDSCQNIAAAADLVSDACQCGLTKSMDVARRRLQELAAASTELKAIAHACYQLSVVIRYGDVRKFDPKPLQPLMAELFVQGALALHAAANCDNAAAQDLVHAIEQLNRVSLEYHELCEADLWLTKLKQLADADDRNPILSGYACATLLERGLIPNEDLAREVSRRLSPGIPADLGAGWFEGLAKRNRYSLLARQPLWVELGSYVQALDDEQFKRALVFLRRAFGSFSPQEKRHICGNLSEHWGVNSDEASELIEQPLTEKEEETLKGLNDFDFDNL